MKTSPLLIIALLFHITAKTQVTFEKVITKGTLESAYSVIQTADGGYAVLAGLGSSAPDRWLVKTNAQGDTLWTKIFRGIGNNRTGDRALVQTADGGFTLIANRAGKLNLLHTSSTGDSLWERELATGNGYILSQASGQRYLLAGQGSTPWFVKVYLASPGGDLMWSREYRLIPSGDVSWPTAWAVREVPGGGFIMAGAITNGYMVSRPFLFRLGATGDSLWFRDYGWYADASVYSVDTAGNDGFFVCGIENLSHTKYLAMKLDASGDTIWTRLAPATAYTTFLSIRSSGDGGAVAAGSYTKPGDSTKLYLARFSGSGSLLWDRKIGHYKAAYGTSVENTADNGFIICGVEAPVTTSYTHGLLVKTDGNGNFAGIGSHKDAPVYAFNPNPASGYTTLHIQPVSSLPLKVTLADLSGRVLKSTTVGPGEHGCLLDVSNLPTGIYLAIISEEIRILARQKLVVTR